ncbi:hypothetical protein HDU86_002647 [Geranomyces michiganensis]|nr:hypothetical protein HDU86_002647 [Geranomyces michiganensis]
MEKSADTLAPSSPPALRKHPPPGTASSLQPAHSLVACPVSTQAIVVVATDSNTVLSVSAAAQRILAGYSGSTSRALVGARWTDLVAHNTGDPPPTTSDPLVVLRIRDAVAPNPRYAQACAHQTPTDPATTLWFLDDVTHIHDLYTTLPSPRSPMRQNASPALVLRLSAFGRILQALPAGNATTFLDRPTTAVLLNAFVMRYIVRSDVGILCGGLSRACRPFGYAVFMVRWSWDAEDEDETDLDESEEENEDGVTDDGDGEDAAMDRGVGGAGDGEEYRDDDDEPATTRNVVSSRDTQNSVAMTEKPHRNDFTYDHNDDHDTVHGSSESISSSRAPSPSPADHTPAEIDAYISSRVQSRRGSLASASFQPQSPPLLPRQHHPISPAPIPPPQLSPDLKPSHCTSTRDSGTWVHFTVGPCPTPANETPDAHNPARHLLCLIQVATTPQHLSPPPPPPTRPLPPSRLPSIHLPPPKYAPLQKDDAHGNHDEFANGWVAAWRASVAAVTKAVEWVVRVFVPRFVWVEIKRWGAGGETNDGTERLGEQGHETTDGRAIP